MLPFNVMRFSDRLTVVHVAILLAASFVLIPIPGHTEETPAGIENLIKAQKWTEVSRALFLEAQRVDPREWSIAVNQAKSGFVDDALASAQLMHPISRSALLLEIVRSAPSLSISRQKEVVQLAWDHAKGNTQSEYHRSGDLTAISLMYVAWGIEARAQTIYRDALAAAEKGLSEASNGGYRRITEELLRPDVSSLREWMFEPLLTRVERTPDLFGAVFAYRDLAKIRYRMGKTAEAMNLLNDGVAASNDMKEGVSKKIAVQALASLAIEMGEIDFAKRHGDQIQLIPEYALYEAARGNQAKALALISGVADTLYVNHRTGTLSRMASDAVRRKDLQSATFYAERLPISWDEMKAWTQIAEVQAANGDRASARASYAKADGALKKRTGTEYYYADVWATVALGESMAQNGFRDDGNQIVAGAIQQVETIPRRRFEDRISALTLVAPALISIGKTVEGTTMLLEAYREAHDYPESDTMAKLKKAGQLSAIGMAAYHFNHPH